MSQTIYVVEHWTSYEHCDLEAAFMDEAAAKRYCDESRLKDLRVATVELVDRIASVARLVHMARQLLRAPNVVTGAALKAALDPFESIPGDGLVAPGATVGIAVSVEELCLAKLRAAGFNGDLLTCVEDSLEQLGSYQKGLHHRGERD